MAAPQRIQLRRDTAAEWAKWNPVLALGEPGYETDTGKYKIGNGRSEWKSLPYKAEVGPAGPPGPAGSAGPAGPVGPAGPKGDPGIQGGSGPASVITIGSVSSGATASASLTGAAPNQVLNLVIPKGDKGDVSPLSVGTVIPGASAAATITGTAPNQVLNLILPQGQKGDRGEAGPKGDVGPAGPIGPAGPQGPQGESGASIVVKGTITRWPPDLTPDVGDLWVVGLTPVSGTPAGSIPGDGFMWDGLSWINVGQVRGPKGEKGDKGDTGAAGTNGAAGPANSLLIGSVTSGDIPNVTLRGVSPNQVIDFVLAKGPKGDAGVQGAAGPQGQAGPPNVLTIGTVSEAPAGTKPSATIVGSSPAQTLNLVLPAGSSAEKYSLAIGTITEGEEFAATITGDYPNQQINFTVCGCKTPDALIAWTKQPENVRVALGKEFTMEAVASSNESPILYQWQFSDTPDIEASWQDIPGRTSTILTLKANDARDGRSYRNTAKTPNASSISNRAQVEVFTDPTNPDGLKIDWLVSLNLPEGDKALHGPFPGGWVDPMHTTAMVTRTKQWDTVPLARANNRYFTYKSYSDDGVNWKPYIKGPADFTGNSVEPDVTEVAYINGVYVMWLSGRRNGAAEDPFYSYNQRFYSSEGSVWTHIKDDRWSGSGAWKYAKDLNNKTLIQSARDSMTGWPSWWEVKSHLGPQTNIASPVGTNRLLLFWEEAEGHEAYTTSFLSSGDNNLQFQKRLSFLGNCSIPDGVLLTGFSYGLLKEPFGEIPVWVALGDDNRLYYSTDPSFAASLKSHEIPPGFFFTQPAYNDGVWVATSGDNNPVYYTSTDLKTWTMHQFDNMSASVNVEAYGRVRVIQNRFVFLWGYTEFSPIAGMNGFRLQGVFYAKKPGDVVDPVARYSLTIGTVDQGDVPAAYISGPPPDQILNLTFPKYRPDPVVSWNLNPEDVAVGNGQLVTLNAWASTNESYITYQWQYTDTPEDESSWVNMPQEGNISLQFIADEAVNNRWYRNTATTIKNFSWSKRAQVKVAQRPIDLTGARTWALSTIPDSFPFRDKLLPWVRLDQRNTSIGGYPFRNANAQVFLCNGMLFTASHSSKDGINWTPYIGGPNANNVGAPEWVQGPKKPVVDTIVYFPEVDSYMMWCSLPTDVVRLTTWQGALVGGLLVGPDGTTTTDDLMNQVLGEMPYLYRYWSRDGISWEHDDRFSGDPSLYSSLRWEMEGTYVLSEDGKEMMWLSTDDGSVNTAVWKASSPTDRTLVANWSEGSAEAAVKNPWGKARYPAFFKRINGVDAATYAIKYWIVPVEGHAPPNRSVIGKAEVTPSLVPNVAVDNLGGQKFTAPMFLGFEYGMVAGSMAYVAYASDGNFYYTRDPSSTEPLIKLPRPPGVLCMDMPVYGNGWWMALSPCDRVSYYTTRDLADTVWNNHSMQDGFGDEFVWDGSLFRTPLVFLPNADSRKPGKFVMGGNQGDYEKEWMRLLTAE